MSNLRRQFSFNALFPSVDIRDAILERFYAKRDKGGYRLLHIDTGQELSREVVLYGIEVRAENAEGPAIWFGSEESSDIEGLVDFLHEELKTRSLETIIGFEWADSTDRLSPGRIRGGAVLISRERIAWMHTGNWLAMQVEALTHERERS